MKFSDIINLEPGSIVEGGYSYPPNAKIELDSLYLRRRDGSIIEGRKTTPGDLITVIDIEYSSQLALIQYPAGDSIVQGFVENNTRIINYLNPYDWHNGSSAESVYLNEDLTGYFGSINPYENATTLHRDGGHCYVAYDAPKKGTREMEMLNKCGFVEYAGTTVNPPVPSQDSLLNISVPSNVTMDYYGVSGLGTPLKYYKIGNGQNILFAGFAMHGFEDDWDHDGTALVHIANQLIEKIANTSNLHGWTVYIANCMNPDGVFSGITNDGPGRCTVMSRMDMNRIFPVGFSQRGNSRNYTGPNPLGAPEAQALYEFILDKHNKHIHGENQMVVLDFHGWMGFTQGNGEIGVYFDDKFGYSHVYSYKGGFFTTWANDLNNTRAMLLEYPVGTRGIAECDNRDYAGKTYAGIMQLLASNAGQGEYKNQWVTQDGWKFYYGSDGKVVTGLQDIGGYIYYFDKNGAMYKGAQNYATGRLCTFNDEGILVHSWYKDNGGYWHYYNNNGVQFTDGTYTIDGKEYTFDKNGACYETPDNGIVRQGWVEDGGYKFYYVNGTPLTGLQQLDGHIYYFDSHGAMYRGAQNEATGMSCTFNNDGMLVHSWYKDNNGYWHYYNNGGEQWVAGTYEIDEKDYTFDKNGACYETPGNGFVKEGWITQDGYKFYYVNGKALTGLQQLDGHMYYFDSHGAMYKGAQNYATGRLCTFNDEGMLVDSWYKDNGGYWHYYNSNGVQYVSGTYTIDGKSYEFDKNGACYEKPGQGKGESDYPLGVINEGWYKGNSGSWYYFVDGKPLTGLWTIDDLFRIFNAEGKLLVNIQSVNTPAGMAYIDEDGVATFDDSNQFLQEFAISPFAKYKNTENFTNKALRHIFRGEVKDVDSDGSYYVGGGHSTWEEFDPLLKPIKRVFINGSKAFEGKISNYNAINIIKTEEHAWFPDEWNPQKLINIIDAAFKQGLRREVEKIPFAEEFLIEYEKVIFKVVISKKTNKIITAYPLVQSRIDCLGNMVLKFMQKLKFTSSEEDNEPGGEETIDGNDSDDNNDENNEGEKDLE